MAYMNKNAELKNGYNAYIDSSVDDMGTQMDVGLLLMEAGDTYVYEDAKKEVAILLFSGSVTYEWDGRYYVTQTSALHFLRNQATGTVRASAWVRHRGKSTVLTAVDITGEGGRLLATGEFTFFCVDKALMDQKAGAEQK